MLSPIDMEKYLDKRNLQMRCGGESGTDALVCNYDWILDIQRTMHQKKCSFPFKQTGANFMKNRKYYNTPQNMQSRQERMANIDI